MSDLTREDLRAVAADLKEYVGDRIDGVNRRLDLVNGRLGRHDEEIRELRQKRSQAPPQTVVEVNRDTDWKMASAGLGILLAGLGGIVEAVRHALNAIKP